MLIVFVVDKNANCKDFVGWYCAPHGTESHGTTAKSDVNWLLHAHKSYRYNPQLGLVAEFCLFGSADLCSIDSLV